ncbi:MAG: NAD(P)-dependent oxidoreductase [Alphaproteobacteria bacterium]|nr:NAD(P)-dependent oxidoreductase [Alphaproteobacteria bacterium]
MTLLVTGAAGHVGLWVARRAAVAGLRVIAACRTPPRAADAASAGANVAWVSCDLDDPAAVAALAAAHAVDSCIHLAAVSNEAYARPSPLAAVQSNVGAAANLLEAARRHDWRRFILVSTGSVFQAADSTSPILEDAPPSPANVYATTKHCAELLTRMYRTQYDLSASVVRISWVYGPPIATDSPTRGPIPAFLRAALAGVARRDPGGADFAASFTYVADAADGLLAAWRAERLEHDIYHLGPGRNFTAGQVAATVRAAVPGAVIELGPGTEPWTSYTTMRGPLAGDRFRADTGYSVAHGLDAGIAAYAAWMRAHPESYR